MANKPLVFYDGEPPSLSPSVAFLAFLADAGLSGLEYGGR
jgi:hypothetical protein